MKGYRTTYLGLFDAPQDERPGIDVVEIPIIQRDFAQGRQDDEASTIRERFLDAIVHACTTEEDLGLDFVYGDVEEGIFRPLDGQQRLTTLFLLHWYVASRAEALDPHAPWLRFSYETRPSARDFCRTIAKHPHPDCSEPPSGWITDQPWYVYPWRKDPTISSMLVMLDAIHERFQHAQAEFPGVWHRLSGRTEPAIWFLLLPVSDMDRGEDLYIKMNSRGKPLTAFEVFKADLQGELAEVLTDDQNEHLKASIDGRWADLLWEYEKTGGGDFIIDEEFMRYLSFIIDICEWRDGEPERRWRDKAEAREWPLEERARLAFADPSNQHAERNRVFFFHAFDTWRDVRPADELWKLFRAGGSGDGPLPLLVSTTPDLFGACISKYGAGFSFAETLMLFAVLLARAEPQLDTADVNRRLRTLRNLAESAFLDSKRMTDYVATVERLIMQGTLDGATGFNAGWTADEQRKWRLMDTDPEVTGALHVLEDLPVIRGRLLAFELDPDTLQMRASAFADIAEPRLRDAFGAALLTKGDYSRDVGWNGRRRQLGNSRNDDSWRDLFSTGSRDSVAPTRIPLMALLDDVGARLAVPGAQPADVLETIRKDWLQERYARRHFDWRFYFVRYRAARSTKGAGYFHNEGYDKALDGFSYRRLRLLHGANYTAYFSDSLLRAVWDQCDRRSDLDKPEWWHRDDPGLALKKSHIEIRCDDDGYELLLPEGDVNAAQKVAEVLRLFRTDEHGRALVWQRPDGHRLIDTEDRIQLCLRLVDALLGAGL